ncbi:A1S_2505 family phage non-structural protein [Rarobacter incanus]|uniref:O-acetyl-ADP-ribose deacetylase (Regulator of RNase III) n=1 Tax=Rarobacter incanus TaxID=153494 RepID=A0A542SPL7_9MICO|nr:hypothetical protein [Rarobacter incanus]TQK76556.1 O-acetyl-ADP-ribose deacetylase (regulator of RNase III) [Rarobacter incanus]
MTDKVTVTPEPVTELPADTIFVFGSNKAGFHGGGAARYAHQHFGAEWGVGDGPTGRCYAIDTMSGWDEMRDAVSRFLDYAAQHPELTFWVSRLGTGIAGYPVTEVSSLFGRRTENVVLPASFLTH